MSSKPNSTETAEQAPEPQAAEPSDSLAALAEQVAGLTVGIETGFERILGITAAQQAQIEALGAQLAEKHAPAEDVPEAKEEQTPAGAPPNIARFFALKSKDYGIWAKQTQTVFVDNRPHVIHGRKLEFFNGILDLDRERDAAEIEFLLNHPDYGTDFVEDPLAIPHERVKVVRGAKTSGQGRAERPAELAARL